MTIEKPYKKKNENKKNSKFFWQVLLPEGRYKRQAPCSEVLETLWLKGAQKWSKVVKNGQKWPKLDYYMVKLPKFLEAVVFQTKWTAIELIYGPSFIYAHAIKCIGLKEAQNSPLKSPKLTL